MRPPELDVTLRLYDLDCTTTEDSGGDEPYLWILGFKVDADTISPTPGSPLPTLGVKVVDGVPASPFVVPWGGEIDAGQSAPIPAALGTRGMRLKPALLPLGGWFPGLAGIVCLLWDQDNFDPGTAEAGYKKFRQLFGPTLSPELTGLLGGTYDDPLSRDANGNVTPDPPTGRTVEWRLQRLRDPAGRKNAVKAITGKVKSEVLGRVKDAITDEAGFDELLDPDDLLGVSAEVFLGDELGSLRNFSLRFTDDDADYTIKGHASGARVNMARLESAVTALSSREDRAAGVWRRVCWSPFKLYWAIAFLQQSTTTFTLRPVLGGAPSAVRWLLDDRPLAAGQGSIGVTFEAVDAYEGPPEDVLQGYFQGGPGQLTYRADGPVLEISNNGGDGVYFGEVRALYSYAGDPSIFPPPATPIAELIKMGYTQTADLAVVAVDLQMNDDYKDDVRRCARITDEIDRKHIAVNWGKLKVDLGYPPPYRDVLLDRAHAAMRLANAAGLDVPVSQPTRSTRSMQRRY
jgi:hypothetical protein